METDSDIIKVNHDEIYYQFAPLNYDYVLYCYLNLNE